MKSNLFAKKKQKILLSPAVLRIVNIKKAAPTSIPQFCKTRGGG